MSHWLQVSVVTSQRHADAVEAALEQAGCMAVTLSDESAQPILEPAPGDTPLWQRLSVTGLFTGDTHGERLLATLAAQLPAGCEPCLTTLAEQDWRNAWRQDYHPMRFGRALWVCPAGERVDDPAATIVEMEPGLAFGTGTHPSTALCLEWLDGLDLRRLCVVDYGCGSGVLGIAAAKLGARQVYATDIDPQALYATRDNAHRNGVADRFHLAPPDALDDVHADVVIANILAGPLIQLASSLAALARPGARLALAGLLQNQGAAVDSAYARWFRLSQTTPSEGWIRLDGQRLE